MGAILIDVIVGNFSFEFLSSKGSVGLLRDRDGDPIHSPNHFGVRLCEHTAEAIR